MEVDYEITEEGLVFTADQEARNEIIELVYQEDKGYSEIEGEVFEYAVCNGLTWVAPEDISALTAAPIFSTSSPDDDGNYPVDAEFWWYENYQISDPIEVLLKTGRVVFTKGQ